MSHGAKRNRIKKFNIHFLQEKATNKPQIFNLKVEATFKSGDMLEGRLSQKNKQLDLAFTFYIKVEA